MADRDSVIDGLDEIMHYNGEQMFYNDIFIREIAEYALSLLKKQKIAMKPKNIDKVGGNCPVCGLRMARSHKYCYQCGQEMDWE